VYDFEIVSLLTELENGTFFSEALLFPELCRYAESSQQAQDNLRNSLPDFLDALPVAEIHSRRSPQKHDTRTVQVLLPPPKRGKYWNEPVTLEFHIVCWQQPGTHHVYVPALAIETVSDSEESVFEILPRNIRSELQRRGVAGSLGDLIWYQRTAQLQTTSNKVDLVVATPKKRMSQLTSDSKDPSVLKDVATYLNPLSLPRAYEVEDQVEKLAERLVGRAGRSVLLVGESGVGKTALTYELISRRRSYHLSSTPFWETTGARLMVGADCFGDWQDRCRKMVSEASKIRAVILLGNLFELAEVARHATTPGGMAGFFRPYLERGDLLTILECTPQQRELLERDHPHLIQTFAIMELEKPSPEKTLAILYAVCKGQRVTQEAIQTVERLHRRYASYSAYPGRPLRFLKEQLREAQEELGSSDLARAFALETGLPAFMVDDNLPLELEKTETFFQQRILGQEEAVALVVDLLASVKAALSPPGQPIASLLFIGPTGVGKTEMARTLCEFLFGDRQRMVRFDMSEYADPFSVERLVGGQDAGHGLLTGKVREQPFGLVLFDELEKADPSFFDLLLQILGEGRLTDQAGRVADFTNSVIVMTSNLGAVSFSKGPLGFRTAESDDQARKAFTSAVKAAFRPELFNRIDRLVPFAPLSLETAKKVAERELERMHNRDGLASESVHLQLGEGVAEILARLGYDRRYGARPLKRAIEKSLLEPLARLVATAGPEGIEVEVEVKGEELIWSHKRPDPARLKSSGTSSALARKALDTRRHAQRIHASRVAHELRNRIHRLNRLEQRKTRTGHLPEELDAQLATLPRRIKLAKKLQTVFEKSYTLETEAVLAVRGHIPPDPDLAKKLEAYSGSLQDLMMALFASRFDDPSRATVILFKEKSSALKPLACAYREFWETQKIEYKSYSLTIQNRETADNKNDEVLRLPYGETSEDRALWCRPSTFAESCANEVVGAAYELKGKLALPLMLGESGLHLFGSSNPKKLEVQVHPNPMACYKPMDGLHLRNSLVGEKRRLYDRARGVVEDPKLEMYKSWKGKALERIVSVMIESDLLRRAREAFA
jgi:ATP-dependent Clp protease ATP-binding subunit ClpC